MLANEKMCPHCGQTLPQTRIPGLAHLTPVQARLLRLLQRAGAEGLTTETLLIRLYPNGYPPGVDTIKTHVSLLRAKLKPCGWNIKSGWGYYRLQRDV